MSTRDARALISAIVCMDSLAARLTRVGAPLTIVHHPARAHAVDIVRSTAVAATVITQTLDFTARALESYPPIRIGVERDAESAPLIEELRRTPRE